MEKQGFAKRVSEQVIRQAQKGDRKAFETIYRTYVAACYSLALRISQDPKLAEDVVQNVFIKVIRNISQFNHKGAFAGWLRRIVSNETISCIRANSRLQLIDNEVTENIEDPSLFDTSWSLVNHDLEKLLGVLPVNARAVIVLHEVEGYNHKEIAKLFGLSESFSKVTLSRAYSKLRALVKELEHSAKGEEKNASK